VPVPVLYHLPAPPPYMPPYTPHHMPVTTPNRPFGPKHRRERRRKRESGMLDMQQLLLDLKSALHHAAPLLVRHQELPAPPGCRSFVTQNCRKVPIEVVKKVPSDQCEEVPGVKCFLELVDEDHPQCFAVPVQECVDELLESPYLVQEETCEDVPKLLCTEIEEKVPIQVCKTVDIRRTPIIVGTTGRMRETTLAGLGRAEIVARLPQAATVSRKRLGGGRRRLLPGAVSKDVTNGYEKESRQQKRDEWVQKREQSEKT